MTRTWGVLTFAILLAACGGAAGPVAASSRPTTAAPASAAAASPAPAAVTEPPKDYGYGAKSSAPAGAALTGELRIADNPRLGKVLAASNGATLYTFKRDTTNTSTCVDACATTWPPYVIGGTVVPPAGLSGKLGTAPRADGGMQVTYNGMPLYRYGADTAPGDANGEGLGGNWFSVKIP